jgi:hypothetical protein
VPDYRGAVVGTEASRTAAETFRALGARPRTYRSGRLPPWRFDGADLDLRTLGTNLYAVYGRSSLTANLGLWPRAYAIVGNARILAALTAGQRRILRRAGEEASRAAMARVAAQEGRQAAGGLCRDADMRFVRATASQIARLRAAVRPVYARLERDPRTRRAIGEIETTKRAVPPAVPLACSPLPRRRGAATVLDGVWLMTASRRQVIAATRDPRSADGEYGRYRLVLHRGRFALSHLGPVLNHEDGSFVVHRPGTVEFRFESNTATYRFNVYRGTLTLRYAGEPTGPIEPTFRPWHRVVG